MSEIRATTISDAAGTGPITLTGQSAAKVFANYGTVTSTSIRDSLNVSSLTDNGSGSTEINLTNSFANTNYAYLGEGSEYHLAVGNATKAVSSFRMTTFNSSHSLTDANQVSPIAIGDLA
jgi:hypothetical protein